MRLDEMLTISTVTLNLEQFAAQYAIAPEMLTLTSDNSDLMGMAVLRLVRMVATLPAKGTISVPDGWVQALKVAEVERSPIMRAVVRRWPVRYRTYHARAYLPDMVVQGRKPFQMAVFDLHET